MRGLALALLAAAARAGPLANYERILAEGGQLGDAGRFEAPMPDEVPKIEMRKVGDARVSPLHYGDDAAEGV